MRILGPFRQLLTRRHFAAVRNQQAHTGRNVVIPLVYCFPEHLDAVAVAHHAARVPRRDDLLLALRDDAACFDPVLVADLDLPAFRHVKRILDQLALGHEHVAHAVNHADFGTAANLRDDRLALGPLARFEQLLHARQTLRDVATRRGRTARVERAQRQLRARLANRLRRDNAHGRAQAHRLATAEIHTIALGADTLPQFAGHRRVNVDLVQIQRVNLLGYFIRQQLAVVHDDLARFRIRDRRRDRAPGNTLGQRLLAEVVRTPHVDRLRRAAVFRQDDQVLRHVHQTPRQIAGVGRAQRRVGQTLARAVRRDEILQRFQTLPEVRLDRHRDNPALRVGHQAAHARQLRDRAKATLACARQRHHGHRTFGIERVAHRVRNVVLGLVPRFHRALILFLFREQAAAVLAVDFVHTRARLQQDVLALLGNRQVSHRYRRARHRRELEADVLDGIHHLDRLLVADHAVDAVDQAIDAALVQQPVHEARLFRQRQVKQHTAGRGLNQHATRLAVRIRPFLLVKIGVGVQLDLGVNVDITQFVGHFDLVDAAKNASFALTAVAHQRDVVHAQHHVLRRAHDGLAVGRLQQVARRQHHLLGFINRLLRQRHVHGHLVAVKVCVKRRTHQRVQLDRLAFHQLRHERLDTQTVQRRRAVQQNRTTLDHLFQHLPDFGRLALDVALGAFHVAGVAIVDQLADDKRPEQLQRHHLRQTTLAHLQLRTDHDHGTAGIVHALAQQVAAETALLALEHVRQRLQLAAAAAAQRLAALAVVDQAVDRFLQHALLVAHNHVRRTQLQQALEAVVAVNHAPVQVVQVRRGKAATVQLHHRAQIGRDHRQHRQNHPLGTIAALAQRFDYLQALGGALGRLLRTRRAHFTPQFARKLVQVHARQDFVKRLRAHAGPEDVAIFALELAIVVLVEELHLVEPFQLVAVDLGLLAQANQFQLQLFANLAGHAVDLALEIGRFAHDGRDLALVIFLDLGLHGREPFRRDFLHHDAVLAPDLFALLDDDRITQHDLGRGRAALLILNPLLNRARFLHDLVARVRQALVERGVQLLELRFQFGNPRRDFQRALLDHLLQLDVDLGFGVAQIFLEALQRAIARVVVHVRDDILRKIQHAVQIAARNIQQKTHVAGHAARVPDVGNRRGQLNVAQALPAHGRTRNLNAAFVTHNAPVADILVLATVTLPVPRRTKDGLAKQTILLRPQPAIVDGFRLGDLTIGP